MSDQGYIDPRQWEAAFGADKMSRLYEAKDMFTALDDKECQREHEEQDGYRWAQTKEDITVTVALPPGTAARQLAVEIRPTHLRAGVKGQAPVIDGTLWAPIKTADGDSTWSVDAGNLVIVLFKRTAEFWGGVVKKE
eukprot:TRINITY_DN8505_c0_g1_i1.p3 TRINITY_DN8505_c0_g1~~TRINITY_DN8505_c0_g1_i1.p3  ORF type:complete len:137 (+),score=38.42 TRINITY_DN8505_c0_g1_i1:820-1230(+)